MTSQMVMNRVEASADSSRDRRGSTYAVLGGSQVTGNLGVSALGLAAVDGIIRADPQAHVILQSRGTPPEVELQLGHRRFTVEQMLLHASNRWRDRSGTRHLDTLGRLAARLPHAIASAVIRRSRTLSQLLRAQAVLDISGGDSFSDIYGRKQFAAQLALQTTRTRARQAAGLAPADDRPLFGRGCSRSCTLDSLPGDPRCEP